MKATEFRIGNLVLRHGCIQSVDEIWKDGFSSTPLNAENVDEGNSDFELIPLTEEWLAKFGFEYDESEIFYIELCDNIYIKIDGGIISIHDIDANKLLELKYVHQLQNLYFALTGEELTIK